MNSMISLILMLMLIKHLLIMICKKINDICHLMKNKYVKSEREREGENDIV